MRRAAVVRDVVPKGMGLNRPNPKPPLRLLPVEDLPPQLPIDEVLAFPEAPAAEALRSLVSEPAVGSQANPEPPVVTAPQPLCDAEQHKLALSHLTKVAACFLVACGLTYVSDHLKEQRPWVEGEPIPVLRKVMSVEWNCALRGQAAGCTHPVEEKVPVPAEESGVLLAGLGVASAHAAPAGKIIPLTKTLALASLKTELEQELFDEPPFRPTPLPVRKIGHPTRVEKLSAYALDPFFDRLHAAEMDQTMTHARIAFFGDSTNSLDGITSTLRERLQSRFGDGGPGFMVIGHFKQQNRRDHLLYRRRGAWQPSPTIWKTSAPGGRYGLGGIVSRNQGRASVEFAPRRIGDKRDKVHRLELFFQGQTRGGVMKLDVNGKAFGKISTKAKGRVDRREVYDFEDPKSHFRVRMGPRDSVALYGAVMEKRQSGVVLDNLSLVGAEYGSFKKQERNHLVRQVRMRNPDLLIFNLAGNMVGRLNPDSQVSRRSWKKRAQQTIERLKAGAPDAACLVVSPLDQGQRYRGRIITRPNLPPAVDLLREVAAAEGCAFWDAWAAMGGSGSMADWRAKRLGWSDLIHVSKRGHRAMGHLFADALIAQYQDWLRQDGPGRHRHYRWIQSEVASR